MVRGNLRVEDAEQVEKDHKQQRCPEHGSHGADNGKHDGAQGTEVPGPLLNDTRCASAASTTVRSDVPSLRQQTILCSTLSNTVQRMPTWLSDLATACTLLKDMLGNGPTSSPSSGASASQQGAPAIKQTPCKGEFVLAGNPKHCSRRSTRTPRSARAIRRKPHCCVQVAMPHCLQQKAHVQSVHGDVNGL